MVGRFGRIAPGALACLERLEVGLTARTSWSTSGAAAAKRPRGSPVRTSARRQGPVLCVGARPSFADPPVRRSSRKARGAESSSSSTVHKPWMSASVRQTTGRWCSSHPIGRSFARVNHSANVRAIRFSTRIKHNGARREGKQRAST